MPTDTSRTSPVVDSVPMVNSELAVGEDLQFQKRWWRFESAVWILFLAIVIADLLGCFGRGYLANAKETVADGMAEIHYERIERFSTPSILTIEFSETAVKKGAIRVWVGDTLLKDLGNQRVIPQPVSSVLEHGGVSYTFQSASIPNSVEFALEPAKPGIFPLSIRIADAPEVKLHIYVMP